MTSLKAKHFNWDQAGSIYMVGYPLVLLPIRSESGMLEVDPTLRTDQRNIPALGRIGDPDDIIASVRVEEGKVRFSTYVVPLCIAQTSTPHRCPRAGSC